MLDLIGMEPFLYIKAYLVLYFRIVTTNVDNLPMFYLLLNSSFIAPRLFSTLPQWVDWECMRILMQMKPSEMT